VGGRLAECGAIMLLHHVVKQNSTTADHKAAATFNSTGAVAVPQWRICSVHLVSAWLRKAGCKGLFEDV
jgi:hypothetical protein